MGSGSTGIGAKVEGFSFMGIERESEYCKIAQARIDAWGEEKSAKDKIELTLF
jgi:site-specific DNA-methyltransferase (adenine-specific)